MKRRERSEGCQSQFTMQHFKLSCYSLSRHIVERLRMEDGGEMRIERFAMVGRRRTAVALALEVAIGGMCSRLESLVKLFPVDVVDC